MEIYIEKAALDDIDKIKDISKVTFIETFANLNSSENMDNYIKDNFNDIVLRKELIDENSIFYLANDNKKTVAYMKINFGAAQTENGHENSLEVQRIYVLKSHKNMKIGKMLMDKAISVAKEKGLYYIWLGVWEKNESAIKFYEKYGFKIFDKHIFKLGDDEQTDYLMKLEL